MHLLRRFVSLVVLLGAEIGAIVALHRLGRVEGFALPSGALRDWLFHAQTEELVAVTARLAGLAVSWWLLVATTLSLARQVVPGWRHVHALDSLTPAVVRRVVERAVAVGLGASLGLSGIHPIGATTASTRPSVDVPVVRSAPSPTRAPASSPTRPPTPTTPPTTTSTRPRDSVVVVRAGDNLWVIAKRALEREQGAVGPAEVVPYWRRVIAANAGGLRSHDPDLVFPGERIVLPEVSGGETTAG
jgi:hypothetical protein